MKTNETYNEEEEEEQEEGGGESGMQETTENKKNKNKDKDKNSKNCLITLFTLLLNTVYVFANLIFNLNRETRH